ncbi:methyltransferase domain-containing protein [Streptomyces radicis]|uniref:Protein-L-isoaspartate O-methyltransferase n=1 Tax=Streptomyces radicis TaxID=1750517 RepID=A0A3A9VXL9_9ACTN|nr:methyltransferase domain-containing protein [Streptomyces radicis]RKN05691.1 methyltransferase domain-containing protein [Streptomyces radicis]RKN17531.1 methyltransferase domain-containing protein [Streptomyces radicis]
MSPLTAEEARADLAHTLTTSGALRTPGWQAAFAAVPREVFAPAFSIRTPRGLRDCTAADPDFWATVYSDDSLITLRDAAGTAISSSSQPSLMARMLEAFTVNDGDRVLEIGTGTGYNTALLCHRLGAERVVSVDIDPVLTEAAREKLRRIGYEPEIITGDGTAGHPGSGPYDGILATCGVHRIPRAWLDQLRPGAVIVANIGAGIVRLVTREDGGATGRYLPEEAGFMPARPVADHVAATAGRYSALIVRTPGRTRVEPLPVAREEAADFYRALALTRAMEVVLVHHGVLGMTLRDGEKTTHGLVHPPTASWARVVPDGAGAVAEVTTGGPRDLWAERRALLVPWFRAGRPGPGRYGLSVDPRGGHTLWREGPDRLSLALT